LLFRKSSSRSALALTLICVILSVWEGAAAWRPLPCASGSGSEDEVGAPASGDQFLLPLEKVPPGVRVVKRVRVSQDTSAFELRRREASVLSFIRAAIDRQPRLACHVMDRPFPLRMGGSDSDTAADLLI